MLQGMSNYIKYCLTYIYEYENFVLPRNTQLAKPMYNVELPSQTLMQTRSVAFTTIIPHLISKLQIVDLCKEAES